MKTGTYFLIAISILAGWPALVVATEIEPLLVIDPSTENPRNSEGDIIELKDGRLCLIYTRFVGGSGDHAAADLVRRTSDDDGRNWSDDGIVVRRPGGLNVMSVSLLRLAGGQIALFYLRKTSEEDCRPLMCISIDETETWSQPTVCITDKVGYYVLNNDHAVQLGSGRIILPVAWHQGPSESRDTAGVIICITSSISRLVAELPPGRFLDCVQVLVPRLCTIRYCHFSKLNCAWVFPFPVVAMSVGE
jgi:hypothetical protein